MGFVSENKRRVKRKVKESAIVGFWQSDDCEEDEVLRNLN